MIDSKNVVQEVQKELLTAVQRGQEQVRKSQEQLRKSREAVTGVVSELAKSVKPAMPAVRIPNPAEVRAHAQELAEHAITVQRDLAGKARHAAGPYAERVIAAQRDLAEKARQAVPHADRFAAVQRDLAERARHAGIGEQVVAAQRTLAGKVIEVAKVATPLVAEGRARLTQMVGGRHEAAHAGPAGDGTAKAAEHAAKLHAVDGGQPAAEKPETAAKATSAPKARTTKASTAKPRATKASTAKPRTAKK